jgi:1-acyl-sn-glycerol-3-phosphate acyltransferase
MWNDSCALPSPFTAADLGTGRGERARRVRVVTSYRERARRVARLVAHLGRMWFGARFLTARLGRWERQALVQRWAAEMLDALTIDVVVRGEVPPKDWPLLVVANHTSWVDTWVLNTLNPARFVAKSEMRRWAIIGTIAERFGTFFIVRGSCRAAARTKTAVARALSAGEPVGAFPEGTTTDGTTVRAFYPALFQAAIDADVLVQPVAIRYLTATGEPTTAAAFIDDMSIVDSLRPILAAPRLIAEVTFCAPLFASGRTRRGLARQSHASISGALGVSAAHTVPSAAIIPSSRRAA